MSNFFSFVRVYSPSDSAKRYEALWNYHRALISTQLRNKENISALCVYWCMAHCINDPTFGKQ